MFRAHKTMPAPAKSPTHKPGGKANDANSLSSTLASTASGVGLPVLGKVNPSHLLVGNKVWVTDPKVLWRIGEVQVINAEQQSADVYLPDAPDEKLQTLSLSKLYTFDPSHIVDHEDIASMNNMHEAPLLSVLRQRFEMDKIYTFTADILLSINPYKTIPLLYDVMGFMEQTKGLTDLSKQPPHLFTIAEKAYSGMKGVIPGSGTPQSIIISGESGAGKTEASKYIMKYLATASKHASAASGGTSSSNAAAAHVHEKIEECVVLSNLILESFGNAKTSRNDNSSRFGKYIQILYNGDGRMVGVSIRHFLLEKTRLVMPQANERNYHIFYQLLAGLTSLGGAEESRLKLRGDVWNYTYLTHGDCVEVDGVDDAVEFDQLRNCLTQLGMDRAGFQMPMFEILAAVLHLGNVQFQSVKDESIGAGSSSSEEKTIPFFPESDQGVDLAHVSALLGVEPQEFAKKMVTQTTITGRGSILEIKLSADQAKNAMDAFCKHLYGELFNHLIARINACAKEHTETAQEKPKSSSKSAASTAAFIGILDIFGFEVMKKNSLEQLCINFTNETLQQQFNKHVFVLEQERYANEGIAFSIVEFKDNQQCLDLIQKPPTGLLPLLEEQMLLKRKTTDKQLLTIYHGQHLDKHPNYTKPRFECDEFVIRHYAGEVVYDIHDFIAKNTDNLHDDLLDLLKRSSQSLVHVIYGAVADSKGPQKRGGTLPASSSASGPNKGKQGAALTGTSTVTSRFRLQLSELMEVLWHTTPNYIKCIKPNNLKFPGGFSCELVRDQLIYSGVLEVVRIRQEGFPIRKRFDIFFELFWSLSVRKYASGVTNVRKDVKLLRDACEQIAVEWLEEKHPLILGKKVFAMGRQEVFLRYGQIEKLEAYVSSLRVEKAVIIQAKLVRCRIAYRKYQVVKKGVRKFQALWRMHAHKVRFRKMKAAALKIQARFRCFSHHKRYRTLKHATSCVFRATMRFLTHKRFVEWATLIKAAVMVQRHVRGFLSRTAAERARKLKERSILAIQSWHRMMTHRRVYLRQRRAIVKIQSEYRSVKMRREFLRRKKASIVLAAFVRQVLQRTKFKMLKLRVVKLQALVRKWKLRAQFVQLRKLVVYMQSKRRQQLAKHVASKRGGAMKTLQHAMQGWICRCHYVSKMKSAVVLQYWAKSWLLQREYRTLKLAAKRVQAAWRRHNRVKRWEAEVDSIFRGASLFAVAAGSGNAEGTSWTQHSKMEESDHRIQKLRQNPELFFHLRPKAYGYNSVFHHAAACGDFHVIKYMLDQVVLTKNELFYMKNGKGNTAFHEACRHGQYEMVKFLIVQARSVFEERSVKPRASLPSDTTGETSSANANGSSEENNNNQSRDDLSSTSQPNQKTVAPKKAEEPEDADALPTGVIYSGYLKKRRETSRWMKRFVVLSVSESHFPQLDYFPNDKSTTLQSKSAKQIDLRVALFKKSMDTPFAFEIHSPHLLEGRNKEGRLYFAAENELEIQKWLAHLRNSIPSSIESRIFAMHRGTKYGKLEFIDFGLRKQICNLQNSAGRRESPLHLAARVNMAAATASSGVGAPNHQQHPLSPSPVAASSKARTLEPAVTASSISVNAEEENNNSKFSNHSSSEIHKANDSSTSLAEEASLLNVGKTKLEVEADIVRTVLWLIESGADINAMTAKKETPLKLALRANNLLVAKHLLDRGALATGLSVAELEEAQRLKASLAKNAISSVGCSSNSSSSSSTVSRLSSFRKKATGASSSASSSTERDDTPVLFLLKQPGRIRHSSYVSVFVEHIGISNPQYLSRPRIVVSVLDSQRNLVEMKQQVSVQPVVLPSSLLWSITWHMQTPLENLPHGACVVFELTISPTVSAMSSTPASSAEDFVPVCWTYIQVDQRTANCMPLNAEMYKYPMDLSLKKLQRVDAFINGDVLISQGPH
ncbi:hypothetical protein Gpo141_00004619 [Globisporangium polare]